MLSWMLAIALAASHPRGALELTDAELFVTNSGGSSVTCGYVRGRWVAGRFFTESRLFLAHSAKVTNLKRSLSGASSSKRSKIQSEINRYSKLASQGRKVCAAGPGGGAGGNFDSAGNVTAAGKIAFGIPANLSADITTGKAVYNSYCVGCHVEKTGKSFSFLRTAIAQSPMLYDEAQIPDAKLAQITAYLNRFRAN